MVRDRLAEFRKATFKDKKNLHGFEESQDENDTDISPSESTEFLNEDHWADVDQFLTRVSDVKKKIEELERMIVKLKDLHSKILISPGAEKNLIEQLNDTVDDFTRLSKQVNSALGPLVEDADRQAEPGEAQYRIKKNQTFTLKRRLQTVLMEFNSEQLAYKEKCESRIHSYLKVVDDKMTEEEVDKAIETGKFYSTVSIIMGNREVAEIVKRDVQNRHEDIIKLEKSIAELHAMFVDVAQLVESQGEMIDNIESNIARAVDYTEKAAKNVTQAKEAKRRNLKMKVAICACLTLLIFLLLTLGAGAFCFYLPFLCR